MRPRLRSQPIQPETAAPAAGTAVRPIRYSPAMAAARDVRVTRAEYAALERSSNVKHEYLDGTIYALSLIHI